MIVDLPGKSQKYGDTTVIQWIVDVRSVYAEAAKTSDLTQHASRALALLSPEEKKDVLKYIFPKDAKMSLVSKLLKRFLISSLTNTPWDLATPTRNVDTKPNFLLPDGTEPLIFNVTHQAGLIGVCAVLNAPAAVAGAGGAGLLLQVGIDIVCPGERKAHDVEAMRKVGLRGFAEIYESVLCRREVDALCALGLEDPDVKLRYFYTLWCLREAYVKMTGEALLASWLGDLEMRYFAPPEVVAEKGDQLEVWFKGNMVRNVRKWLANYAEDFIICTFIRDREGTEDWSFDKYVPVSLEDIVVAAEETKRRSAVH